MADESSVPLGWVLLFVLLTLGVGVAAIYFVGGSLIATGALLLA